jgi:hypothetical protein
MTKSIVDDLKAELAQKRAFVTECEEALAKERAAAEEHVAKKVAKAEENLRKAREEVESVVSEVAQTLGLPDVVLARKTKQRRRRVRELLAQHETLEQIAAETGEPLEVVKDDVARLSKGSKKGVTKRVWTRTRVCELLQAGHTPEEVAEELDLTAQEVDAHVEKLRSMGKLNVALERRPSRPAGEESPRRAAVEERSEKAAAAAGSSHQPPTSAGDDVGDLRREVARQQAGSPAKAAQLLASPTSGHGHVVLVDRMGDGTTQSDGTGHVHKVYRYVVSLAAGHQHGLRVPPGSGRA